VGHLQVLNLSLHKFDELDSLLQGLQYVELNNPSECYYWANPTLEAKCEKVNYDFSKPYPFLVGCFLALFLTCNVFTLVTIYENMNYPYF
jgi:hypothetical protein